MPAGTEGSYWKGIVLTEADLNFTYRQFIEEDATEYHTMFKRIGALIIITLFWEFAPEYLVAEGATGVVASNLGVVSAASLSELTAGSVILLLAAPEITKLTQDGVKELSNLKVGSLNIADGAEIDKVKTIVYEAMAANMLSSTAIQNPSNTVGMTDEEISKEIKEKILSALSSKYKIYDIQQIVTVVVGVRKSEEGIKYAVGVKCNHLFFGDEVEDLLRDKLSIDNLSIDVMVAGNDYIMDFPKLAGTEFMNMGPCAEDFCVMQLGGVSAAENGEIIMGQAFRFRKVNGVVDIKEVPVCEKCEFLYERKSFAPNVKFASGEPKS